MPIRVHPLGVLAGWLIVFFPVLACVLLFLLRVLVWLVRLRLIRLCHVCVCGLLVGCDCGCCCGLAWCRVQCSALAVALCCPSFLLQLRCSGPVQLCLLSVWPRSHWSVAVTGCPHLAQMCVSPVASRASHALRRWRCAVSYPLAVELPRCWLYAWAWAWQNLCPCGTSCGQLCQAHRRRLTVESSSLWWCVVLRAGVEPALVWGALSLSSRAFDLKEAGSHGR